MDGLLDGAVSTLLVPLGLVLPATSRAFVPAFVAAAYLRAAPVLWAGTQFEVISRIAESEVPWFTSDAALVILGILAVLDVLATKNKDVEEGLRQLDPFLKPVMAVITSHGIISSGGLAASSGDTSSTALALLASAVSGAAVFGGVLLRSEILEVFDDLDVEELYKAFSWLEDFLVIGSVILLVVLPAMMLVLSSLFMVALYAAGWILEKRAARARSPCPSCGQPVWPHALHCASCQHPNSAPRAVGAFGLPKDAAAPTDRVAHQLQLLRCGRCPRCATSLMRRVGAQACTACGNRVFASEGAIRAYADSTSGDVEKRTLLWCFALGFIPLVGVIPAIILYRTRLVSPYRRYLPTWQSLGLRWLARVVSFLLLVLQLFPLVGMISLPLMAWSNHRLHRAAFSRTARAQAKTLERRREAPAWKLAMTGPWARRARIAFVPALAITGVLVGVLSLMTFAASAESQPECPGDADGLVGVWEERITWFGRGGSPLLTERFDGQGRYDLNGAAGEYRVAAPGRLDLEVPAAPRSYRFWVDEQFLFYLSESDVLSVYGRASEPLSPVPGCPRLLDRAPGPWVGRDGRTLVVAADGTLSLDGASGRWSETGDVEWGGEAGRILINDADEILIATEDAALFVGDRAGAVRSAP